jgi:DNA-binding MarR family transcriptional regulator
VAKDEIPEEVRKLIAEHIVSVEQLEVLLLVRERCGEPWTPEGISEVIRTSASSAGQRLRDLEARGFLSSEGDEDGKARYRFVPGGRWEHALERLAALYAERHYTVIELIFSKPIQNLRVYSDAFLFRKDPSDG